MDNISAHKLRQLNREESKKSIKRDAKKLIEEYINQNSMQPPCELQHHYEAINQLLEGTFDTAQNFQLARRGFLEFVRDYNKTHQIYLNEPVVPILATRERLTINYDWFVNGRAVADSSATMIKVWQRKRRFSVNDLVEGVLYCSIMYGGMNDIEVLKALYDWLFGERQIYQISMPATDEKSRAEYLAVISLKVCDDNYGCVADESESLHRFVDYVPDDMSLCFLYALKDKELNTTKIKSFNTIINDISKTLKLTNKDIDRPQHSLLIKYANYHWRQIEGSLIDGALTVVKQGDLKTTGLPTEKLIHYNRELIKPSPEPLEWSELFDASYQTAGKSQDKRNATAYPSFSKNLIKELQDALKLTRVAAISTITTLKTDASQPNAQRLLSWTLSLLGDNSIRLNTISKYAGCIGRDWLMLTMDEDMDQWEGNDFEEVYEQIIQSKVKDGRRTSVLSKSSEFDDTSSGIDNDNNTTGQALSHLDRLKDSQKFTYGRLKAFHDYQRAHFDAPYVYFPWGNNRQVIKANIVSPRIYHAMKDYLKSSTLDSDQKRLCLVVLSLAYRTGMRINELIGIKVSDVTDIYTDNLDQKVEFPQILLRPNRYRRLKSSSAKRMIPIDCLLKPEELEQLLSLYHYQTRLKQSYLFSQGSGDQPLPHIFFSNLMKVMWDRLLGDHDFTFHSLRHTAISHLAVVLNQSPLAQLLTDYDAMHCTAISKGVLAYNQDQGVWFGLASFAGHLTPDTTFEHYIHTAHLLAGWQMSEAKLTLPLMVLEAVTKINYQAVNREDGSAYDAKTKLVALSKLRPYLIKKLVGHKTSLFVESVEQKKGSESSQQATENATDTEKPEVKSILINPKYHDVIAFLEEIQELKVEKRQENLAEVAIRHGISITEAKCIYHKAEQVFTNDKLLLGAPRGRKNQELLIKALDRVYQMSIEEPEQLTEFVEIFSNKHNMKTSSLHFGVKESQLIMLEQFVSIGTRLVDSLYWQIRSDSEKAVSHLKKELKLDSNIRTGTRENYKGYEVRVVQRKRRHSDKNLTKADSYYASSGLLKYVGYLLMILIKY
ncbi:site-specific integrase [Psychrobacter sp. APC 3281]|uniref:site-specific integrase n=1 Tax=Psychrobacter sp. APC 3281 TaxID=3035190 RepID=UPI0025B29AB3|nr:site-specific integrase [Psychrobacter sp. APC 3281]MDN3446144.1 site-specific integrase [Psychrobacter sp. APC 3281]